MAMVVLKLGDDVSTDVIYPGRYMATVLPTETPEFAFADYPDVNTKLKNKQIQPGSVIVAGKNFGCGSSREQAVSALRGHDLVVAAEGFARIFLQNAVNLGLQLVEVPGIKASEGDNVEIEKGHFVNSTTGSRFEIRQLSSARQEIIDAGGLIPFTRKRLRENAQR